MLDREFIKMLDREFIKGHLHCKTIISEKVSFEALVKNFLISQLCSFLKIFKF